MTANPLVKSILDEISIKIYQGSDYDGRKAAAKNQRPLVLLCGSDFEKDQVLKALDRAAQKYGPLTVALTRHAERFYPAETLRKRDSVGKVFTESDDGDMERWLKSVHRIWCPNVTQNTLVKLSKGMTDSMSTCLLWWGLTMEKPVTLTINAASHWTAKLPGNHAMCMVLDEALKQVEAFGARMITDYCEDPQEPASEAPATLTGVRLIHEGNLMAEAGTQKKLTLSKGQLITPAAKDMASARGIEITWK